MSLKIKKVNPSINKQPPPANPVTNGKNKTPSPKAKWSHNSATPPPSTLAKAIIDTDTGHNDASMHNDERSKVLESIAEDEDASSINDPDDDAMVTTHVQDEDEKCIETHQMIIDTPSSPNKEEPQEDTKKQTVKR